MCRSIARERRKEKLDFTKSKPKMQKFEVIGNDWLFAFQKRYSARNVGNHVINKMDDIIQSLIASSKSLVLFVQILKIYTLIYCHS